MPGRRGRLCWRHQQPCRCRVRRGRQAVRRPQCQRPPQPSSRRRPTQPRGRSPFGRGSQGSQRVAALGAAAGVGLRGRRQRSKCRATRDAVGKVIEPAHSESREQPRGRRLVRGRSICRCHCHCRRHRCRHGCCVVSSTGRGGGRREATRRGTYLFGRRARTRAAAARAFTAAEPARARSARLRAACRVRAVAVPSRRDAAHAAATRPTRQPRARPRRCAPSWDDCDGRRWHRRRCAPRHVVRARPWPYLHARRAASSGGGMREGGCPRPS